MAGPFSLEWKILHLAGTNPPILAQTHRGDVEHYSWGNMNTYLLIPDSDLTTDHSKDTGKAQLGESMNFMKANYRSMGEGLLREAEITQ